MNNQNESGRSVIELLSVLTIMTVITIGIIGLYQYGVDEAIAQDTYEEIQKRAVTNMERFKGHKYMFDARPAHNVTAHGYSITAGSDSTNPNYVVVSVTGLTQSVCNHIMRKARKIRKKMLPVYYLRLNKAIYEANAFPDECPNEASINLQLFFYRSFDPSREPNKLFSVCTSNSQCQTSPDSCSTCDTDQRICVLDDTVCQVNEKCYRAAGSEYPKCYLVADHSEVQPCGAGDCWSIEEDYCIPDSDNCSTGQTCGDDGFCE